MLQYLVRKIFHTLFVALGVVTLVFVALRLSGDPAATMLPGDASVDELRALRHTLGLDRPLPVQYVAFLGAAVRGDFGESFRHQQPAFALVLERLPATLELAFAALLLAVGVALPLGIVAALRRGRAADVLAMGFAVVGQATPYFWMGIMLILVADTDFGYNPALKPYPTEPERAKKLLAEAGFAGGVDVALYAGSGTMVNDKQLLEAIADMWSKVGIRAKVEMMEMASRQKMVNERTLPPNGVLLINPQSTLLDADGSLWRLLHPSGFNGKYWIGSQPGQRFHDLMEQARYTLDPKKRKELYTDATRIVHEEKPWIELFQEVVIYGVGRRVSFKPRPDYRLIAAEMTVAR